METDRQTDRQTDRHEHTESTSFLFLLIKVIQVNKKKITSGTNPQPKFRGAGDVDVSFAQFIELRNK